MIEPVKIDLDIENLPHKLDLSGVPDTEIKPEQSISSISGHFWQELKQWPSRVATGLRASTEQDIREAEKDPNNALWSSYSRMSRREKSKALLTMNQNTERGLGTEEALRQGIVAGMKERADFYRSIEKHPAFKKAEGYEQPDTFLEKVAAGIGGSIPDMALSAVSPVIGAGSMYKRIQGQTIQALEERGVDPERALNAGTINASVQTPFELIGNLIQIKAILGTGAFKQLVMDIAEAIGANFITEFAQEFPDQLSLFWAMNPDLGPEQMRNALMEKATDIETIGQAFESGLIGAASGGILTVGGKATTGILGTFISPEQKQINDERNARINHLLNKIDTLTDEQETELRNISGAPEDANIKEIVERVKSRVEFQTEIKSQTRDEIISGLKSITTRSGKQKYSNEQIKAYTSLWDGIAQSWAEREGKDPAKWYDQWLSGVQNSKVADVQSAQFQVENPPESDIIPPMTSKQGPGDITTKKTSESPMGGINIADIDNKVERFRNGEIQVKTVGYRYGRAPEGGRSYNTRDSKYEKGVSMAGVYGFDESKGFATMDAATKYKKYYYTGDIVGFGGDDEFVMQNIRQITKAEYKKKGLEYQESELILKKSLLKTAKNLNNLGYSGYDKEVLKMQGAVSELIAKIKSIPNPSSQAGEPGKVRPTVTPTEDNLQFQKKKGRKKGAIEFLGDKGPAIIHAFESADASTPIHETGHLLMEMLNRENESDYLSMAKWAGVDDTRSATGYEAWTTEEREKIAKGFEAYVMEGRAPTMRLQSIFRKLKSWLIDIYKSVKALDITIDDTVRGIFDRMVSTETQRNNDPFYDELSEWVQVDDLNKETHIDDMASIEDLQAEAARRVAKSLQSKRAAEEKKVREALMKEARESMENNPVFDLMSDIRADGGLDLNELKYLYDKDFINDVIHRLPGLISYEGKVKPDVIAMQYGYYNTDDMIQALMQSKTKQESIDDYFDSLWNEYQIELEYDNMNEYSKVIDEEINILNSMLLEKKPTPQQVATRAIFKGYEKILNAAEVVHITELKGVHRRMKAEEAKKIDALWKKFWNMKDRLNSEIERLEQKAELNLEAKEYEYLFKLDKKQREKEVAKIKSELQEQKQAEVKKEQIKRLRSKQAERILKIKETQRLRVRAIRDKVKEQSEKRKIHARMKRHIRTKNVLPEYKAQLNALLKQYNYAIPKTFDIQAEQTSEAFLKDVELSDQYAGETLRNELAELPPPKTKGKLTLEELNQLGRVGDMLIYIGRQEKSRREGKQKEELDNKINEMISAITETYGLLSDDFGRPTPPSARMGKFKRLQEQKDRFSASLQKAEFIFRALDGFKDMGPNWQIFETINKAYNHELELGEQFAQKLKKVFKDKNFDKRWAQKKYDIGMPETWTKEELIMVALNSGNKQNYAYVRDGYGFTEDQISNILKRLDKEEVALVNDIWKILDELYPHLNNVHKKLTGVTLPKVEGHYFPLKWDRELSHTAAIFAEKAIQQDLFASNAYYKASVDAPHRIARKRGGRRPQPLLSFSVLSEHLTKSIHDITHQIPVREAQKLINDSRYRAIVTNALGKAVYQQLQPWLNYVARPQMEPQTQTEKWIGRVRRNATVVGLGFKLTVAQKQLLSLSQTVDEVGKYEVAKAMAQFYASPIETSEFIKSRSTMIRFRRKQWDRELIQFINRFNPIMNKYGEAARNSYFWLIGMMDAGATYPSWLAGYNVGMKRFNGDEQRATTYADLVVRRTQPVASPKDLSEIQRGGELRKSLTMFYTFFNVYQNRMVEIRRQLKTGNIDYFQAFKSYWWIMIFPAIMAGVIQRRRLSDPEEMIKDVISYRMAALPVIRDLTNPLLSGFDYTISPIEGAGKSFIRTGTSAINLFDESKKDAARKFIKHSIKSSGYLFGLPSAQLSITVDGLIDLSQGKTNNPARLLFSEEKRKKNMATRR